MESRCLLTGALKVGALTACLLFASAALLDSAFGGSLLRRARTQKLPSGPAAGVRALREKEESEPIALMGMSQASVALYPTGGYCTWVKGPIKGDGVGDLHLWSSTQEHMVCFPFPVDADDRAGADDEGISFVARAEPKLDDGERGDFGFGEGAQVGIRPNLLASAISYLEDGVMSLPISVSEGQPVQLCALHQEEGQKARDGDELPLVMISPRNDLSFDVLLADATTDSKQEVDAAIACDADLDYRRFACRAHKERPGAKVHIVVVCNDCMSVAGQGGRRIYVQQLSSEWDEVQKKVDVASIGDGAPWVGWSTEAPKLETAKSAKNFRIAVGAEPAGAATDSRRLSDGAAMDEYDVVLVLGAAALPWDVEGPAPSYYKDAGEYLNLGALGAAALYFLVLLFQGMGLPASSSTPLPVFSCAVVAVQYLALLGSAEDSPGRLKLIAQPLESFGSAWYAFLLLLATVVLHLVAVIRHIVRNGDGAVDNLPHGLQFGSFELRVLGVMIMPLSYWIGTWIFQLKRISDLFYMIDIVAGFAMLAVMVALPVTIYRTVQWWEKEHIIINLPLPGTTDMFWTDCHCDQLRAIPMTTLTTAGWKGIANFRRWAENSSWYFAPTLATVDEISWSLMSGGKGTWGRPGKHDKRREHRDHGDDLTHAHLADRQLSNASAKHGSATVRTETDLNLQGSSKRGKKKRGILSNRPDGEDDEESNAGSSACISHGAEAPLNFPAALYAHPIRVTTQYVYRGGLTSARIAGLAGLTWLQVAVPIPELQALERELTNVELRVHPGQLTGKHTGGRLSALFDWCDRHPWRWPADVLVKIALGLYLSSLRVMGGRIGWAFLHGSISLACVGLAYLVLTNQPYVSRTDNVSLVIALVTVGSGATQLILARHLSYAETANCLPSLAVLLTAFLVVFLAFMSLCVILTMFVTICRSFPNAVVPLTVRRWQGRPSDTSVASVTSVDDGVDSVKIIGRRESVEQDDLEDEEERRAVEALVRLRQKGDDMPLPARCRTPAKVHTVKLESAASVPPGGATNTRIPVDMGSLFAQKRNGMPVDQPFGILSVPGVGEYCLYESQNLNDGGSSWEDLVAKAFKGHQGSAKEASMILHEALKRAKGSNQSVDEMPVVKAL